MRLDLHAVGVPSTEERTPEEARSEAQAQEVTNGH